MNPESIHYEKGKNLPLSENKNMTNSFKGKDN